MKRKIKIAADSSGIQVLYSQNWEYYALQIQGFDKDG